MSLQPFSKEPLLPKGEITIPKDLEEEVIIFSIIQRLPELAIVDVVAKQLADSISFEREDNKLPMELYRDSILEMLKVVRTYSFVERQELEKASLGFLDLLVNSGIDETKWSQDAMKMLSRLLPARGGPDDDEDVEGEVYTQQPKSFGYRRIFGGIVSIGILIGSIFVVNQMDVPTATEGSSSRALTEASLPRVSLQEATASSLQMVEAETQRFVAQELLFEKTAQETQKLVQEGLAIVDRAQETIEGQVKELVDRFTSILNPTSAPSWGGLFTSETPSKFSNPSLETSYPAYKEALTNARNVLNNPSSSITARLETVRTLLSTLEAAMRVPANRELVKGQPLAAEIGTLSRGLYDYVERHQLGIQGKRQTYENSRDAFVRGRFTTAQQTGRTLAMNELAYGTYLVETITRSVVPVIQTMDRCGQMMIMQSAVRDSIRVQAIEQGRPGSARSGAGEGALQLAEQGRPSRSARSGAGELSAGDDVDDDDDDKEAETEEPSVQMGERGEFSMTFSKEAVAKGIEMDHTRSVELYRAIQICKGTLTNPDLLRIKNRQAFRDLSLRLAGNIEIAKTFTQSVKNRLAETTTRVLNTIHTIQEFIRTTEPTPDTLGTLQETLQALPPWISPDDTIEIQHSGTLYTIRTSTRSRVNNLENSFREQIQTRLGDLGSTPTQTARLGALDSLITETFGGDYSDLNDAIMEDLNENFGSRENERGSTFVRDSIILAEGSTLFPLTGEDTINPVSEEIRQYVQTSVIPSLITRSNQRLSSIASSETFVGRLQFWGWTQLGTPVIARFHQLTDQALRGLGSITGFMGELMRDAVMLSVSILGGAAVVYYVINRSVSGGIFNFLTCGVCRRSGGGEPPTSQQLATMTRLPQGMEAMGGYPVLGMMPSPYIPGGMLALPPSASGGAPAGAPQGGIMMAPGMIMAPPGWMYAMAHMGVMPGPGAGAIVPMAPQLRPVRGHQGDALPKPQAGYRWEWAAGPSPSDPEDGIWRQVLDTPPRLQQARGRRHRTQKKHNRRQHRTKKQRHHKTRKHHHLRKRQTKRK